MIGWLQDLDGPQRRLLVALAALLTVAAIVLGVTSFGERDGSASVGLQTGPGRRFDFSSAVDSRRATTSSTRTSGTFGTSDTVGLTSGATGAMVTTAAPSAATGPATTANATATTKAPTTTKAPSTTQARPTPQAPATTQPPSSGPCNPGGGGAAANQIATLFCQYRANQGLPPVSRNATLDQSAAEWAQRMANDGALSHRPNAAAVVAATCCPGWGENVGFHQSASAVWQGWLDSPLHLDNIRVNKVGEYGVGSFVDAGGTIWVVHMFGWH